MNAMRPFVPGAVAWERVATKPAQTAVSPMSRSALRRFIPASFGRRYRIEVAGLLADLHLPVGLGRSRLESSSRVRVRRGCRRGRALLLRDEAVALEPVAQRFDQHPPVLGVAVALRAASNGLRWRVSLPSDSSRGTLLPGQVGGGDRAQPPEAASVGVDHKRAASRVGAEGDQPAVGGPDRWRPIADTAAGAIETLLT